MTTEPTAGNGERDALEPPAWNTVDPANSFARYAAWLNEKARFTFLTDGTHVEIVFFLRADGAGGIVTPPPDVDRDQMVATLKDAIRANDIYGVVHICEAWMYFPKHPNDHTFKQVMQGEIAVSELRPEDRTEALTVHMESREGASRMWLNQIIRTTQGVALPP